MKLVLTLLGVFLLFVAAVYFLVPADQLPSFFPGHETGLDRVRTKHGIASGVAGLVRLRAGGRVGRWGGGGGGGAGGRRSGRPRGRDAEVPPGDESGASRDTKCPPPRRPHRLHLGREIQALARDIWTRSCARWRN